MMTNYEENESDPCRSTDTIPAQSEPNGYQQALSDFGITELLEVLSNFKDADFDAHSLHFRRGFKPRLFLGGLIDAGA